MLYMIRLASSRFRDKQQVNHEGEAQHARVIYKFF